MLQSCWQCLEVEIVFRDVGSVSMGQTTPLASPEWPHGPGMQPRQPEGLEPDFPSSKLFTRQSVPLACLVQTEQTAMDRQDEFSFAPSGPVCGFRQRKIAQCERQSIKTSNGFVGISCVSTHDFTHLSGNSRSHPLRCINSGGY